MMRRRLIQLTPPVVVAGLLLAAACMAGEPSTPLQVQSQPVEITATAIPLKSDDPSTRHVGRLIWRGGLSLKANSPYFGGWSDLHVTPDGRQLTSVADVGQWLTATIDYDKDGNLAGLSSARIGPLHGPGGKPLSGKIEADSEGMARLPDGSWLVSFEREHRIWRYPTLEGIPTRIDDPPDVARQPNNGGIEALTALPDGRIVAISEDYSEHPGSNVGWLGTPAAGGHYSWAKFEYATKPDFSPTAIVPLPEGSGMALLERAFDPVRGVRVRVMQFAEADLKPGALVRAEEIAFLVNPYAVDNLEGIAATKGPRGETLLWLISDDNFNPLQRNLLLMFEIAK